MVDGLRRLYEDDDIVVVDKPVGVAAHPSPGWTGPTVTGGLAALGVRLSSSGAAERQGIVHRLDAGTTGIMVVAKSGRAYTALKRAFKQREVTKRYHALVQGHPDPTRGTVDAPIDRHPRQDWRFAVVAGGRPSVTHYDTIEAFPAARLLDINLRTGRTHQIRVHMSALRHPCVGDITYGADPTLAARLGLSRQWLHAVARFRPPLSRRASGVHQRVPGRPAPRPRGAALDGSAHDQASVRAVPAVRRGGDRRDGLGGWPAVAGGGRGGAAFAGRGPVGARSGTARRRVPGRAARALPPAGAVGVPALVQFGDEHDLADVVTLLAGAGVTPEQVVFRVPLLRVQTALRFERLPTVDLADPVEAAQRRLALAQQGAQRDAEAESATLTGRQAQLARYRGRGAHRSGQVCAGNTGGRRPSGVDPAPARPGVRAVDAAPKGTPVTGVALAPLLPEQTEVAGPVPDDGPVPR